MNHEKWAAGLQQLSLAGLNLFLSTPLNKLPEKILKVLEKENIPYENYHSLILIGHGGKSLWKNLPHPIHAHPDHHVIDDFSVKKIQAFTTSVLKDEPPLLLFPHSSHTIPLQELGRFFHLCHPSPLGIDINLEFGLWFAFRGVFLTKTPLPEKFFSPFLSPCLSCLERPCLLPEDFWQARRACPYQNEHAYEPSQQEYHQKFAQNIN